MKCGIIFSCAVLASAVSLSCSKDQESMQNGSSQNGSMLKAVEGDIRATTGPASGYDQSDPQHFHPASDDVQKYHAADPATVQPR